MIKNHPILMKLKRDLEKVHLDWQEANLLKSTSLLHIMAKDLIKLNQDALEAMKIKECKAKAEEVHYLLSTPWGAPFVGEMTLLEAAEAFKDTPDSPLLHLLQDFAKYGHKFHSQIFDIFEDIHEEIN